MLKSPKSSRLENKIKVLETHVTDLEAANTALAERMKGADLVARVEKLEVSTRHLLRLSLFTETESP